MQTCAQYIHPELLHLTKEFGYTTVTLDYDVANDMYRFMFVRSDRTYTKVKLPMRLFNEYRDETIRHLEVMHFIRSELLHSLALV